jgi:hypothetical protein
VSRLTNRKVAVYFSPDRGRHPLWNLRTLGAEALLRGRDRRRRGSLVSKRLAKALDVSVPELLS